MLKNLRSKLIWLAIMVAGFVLIDIGEFTGIVNSFIENALVTIGINIILAVGLNLIIGFSGQFFIGSRRVYGNRSVCDCYCHAKYGDPAWLLPCHATGDGDCRDCRVNCRHSDPALAW